MGDATVIELTEERIDAMEPTQAAPTRVVNPRTREAFARKAIPKSEYPMPHPAEAWQAKLQLERNGWRGIPLREAVSRAKAARND